MNTIFRKITFRKKEKDFVDIKKSIYSIKPSREKKNVIILYKLCVPTTFQ